MGRRSRAVMQEVVVQLDEFRRGVETGILRQRPPSLPESIQRTGAEPGDRHQMVPVSRRRPTRYCG
ncbi:hypothetical protein [Micromonospora sp. LOL_023]|uniref:hypothetical protein n=1 Tax=Micromonospora sp. LOL_023 TaxID=3345418 RepID=UPI003A84C7B6